MLPSDRHTSLLATVQIRSGPLVPSAVQGARVVHDAQAVDFARQLADVSAWPRRWQLSPMSRSMIGRRARLAADADASEKLRDSGREGGKHLTGRCPSNCLVWGFDGRNAKPKAFQHEAIQGYLKGQRDF
jgi:hypothetical protein